MRGLKVKDVMSHPVITLAPGDSIREATRLLAQNGIAGAPVIEKGKLIGMITEQDIVRAVLPPVPSEGSLSVLEVLAHLDSVTNRPMKRTVADAMTTLVVDISPEAGVSEAATEMEERGVNRLPVVDADGALVGIVSRADLVRIMGEGPNDADEG
jgi:CBS domain-containing protein